ncbi:hypothetical protein ACH5RR_007818 [Cinchona calisaya]|uniref:Uncharacterized protein n=1 Tax=Cinchona calisaya TaxID=153742 RepID=A0ABD3A9L8_9GENT
MQGSPGIGSVRKEGVNLVWDYARESVGIQERISCGTMQGSQRYWCSYAIESMVLVLQCKGVQELGSPGIGSVRKGVQERILCGLDYARESRSESRVISARSEIGSVVLVLLCKGVQELGQYARESRSNYARESDLDYARESRSESRVVSVRGEIGSVVLVLLCKGVQELGQGSLGVQELGQYARESRNDYARESVVLLLLCKEVQELGQYARESRNDYAREFRSESCVVSARSEIGSVVLVLLCKGVQELGQYARESRTKSRVVMETMQGSPGANLVWSLQKEVQELGQYARESRSESRMVYGDYARESRSKSLVVSTMQGSPGANLMWSLHGVRLGSPGIGSVRKGEIGSMVLVLLCKGVQELGQYARVRLGQWYWCSYARESRNWVSTQGSLGIELVRKGEIGSVVLVLLCKEVQELGCKGVRELGQWYWAATMQGSPGIGSVHGVRLGRSPGCNGVQDARESRNWVSSIGPRLCKGV